MKYIKRIVALSLLLFPLLSTVGIKANSNVPAYISAEPFKIRCTCYCDTGYTYSGQWTRHGIIAGCKAWQGKTVGIYACNEDGSMGDLIGWYECLDTGYGINGSLINGTSIDVWQPDLASCYNWIDTYGDYVYIILFDAEG